MNELEKALAKQSDYDLDLYLGLKPLDKIRLDIEDIKRKAADVTDATSKIAAIKSILMKEP